MVLYWYSSGTVPIHAGGGTPENIQYTLLQCINATPNSALKRVAPIFSWEPALIGPVTGEGGVKKSRAKLLVPCFPIDNFRHFRHYDIMTL